MNSNNQKINDRDMFSKENEIIFYKHENKKLKSLVNCSVCETNQKEQVLPCGHMLCNNCLKTQISSRMRNCPTCRKKFSEKQPLKIFLNDALDQEAEEEMMNLD